MAQKGAAPHGHRSLESSKVKDSKSPVQQEQNPHLHQSPVQPSTSKAVKKPGAPHLLQIDASVDKPGKKKKFIIPKISITRPSDEVLVTTFADELPETKTIRDSEDYGPFTVHSKPSTVDAYRSQREVQIAERPFARRLWRTFLHICVICFGCFEEKRDRTFLR
ncbi:spermatogenesis-associated protein 33 isoform X2 [Hemicordylus capensis]|uniref:spermatogenesis-associated protein 33 isoform X2 n=1 Tax=Hemicordylus capensis TaxID=884348 RepID=UPI00230439F8|nr:spermatogenesis-associated protein 33 isoform X2 [Hemicordylus capensis]